MQRSKTMVMGTIIGELTLLAIVGATLYASFPLIHSYVLGFEDKTDTFVVLFVLIIVTIVFLSTSISRIVFRVRILLRKTNPLTDK
jgi:hypothetical protein